MKVRLKVRMSGLRGAGWVDESGYAHGAGEDWPPHGTVMDIDDDEGAHLCRAGIAEPVVDMHTETATPPAAEQRTGTSEATPNATMSATADLAPDELTALRAKATELGITVDGRWGAARLREAIEAAQG